MTTDKNILIKNIYYMLAYAFQTLRQNNYERIASEDFEHAEDLFAEILSRGISHLLKQGLYREYTQQRKSLQAIRGKLDIDGTIRHQLNRQRIVSCDYDELSVDNVYNQILKTTILILMQQERVQTVHKRELKKLMMFFSDVSLLAHPKIINWRSLRLQRNNQLYRMLLNICYFVLHSLLPTTENGKYRMPAFSDSQMSLLFEKFVLAYYKEKHPELMPEPSELEWDYDKADADNTGIEYLPKMRLDIRLTQGEKSLIIDTKYYGQSMQEYYNKYSYHSDNLYQILAYVKNHDKVHSGDTSGMLLYAKTAGEINPDARICIGGNMIYIRTLDLNKEFSGIEQQLETIAQLLSP
jgi:5-methylcytosine-specific restriction enzyme subunit McrC